MTLVTGIDMSGGELRAPRGVSLGGGGNNVPKYLALDYNKDYFIRVVSGFLPYLSYYRNNQASLISPATLALTQSVQTPNGRVDQHIYLKDDGTPYSPEECYCPLMESNNPQTRYATNIVNWEEVNSNPEGPVNIYVLTGGISIFQHFLYFKTEHRSYPVFDPDRGPVWRIRKIRDSKVGVGYIVENASDVFNGALPPFLRAEVELIKEKPGDPGIWPLKKECHPFMCSEKQAIDNGYNPIFKAKKEAQSQAHSFGIKVASTPLVGPGQIAPQQVIPQQVYQQQVTPQQVPQMAPQQVQPQQAPQQQFQPQFQPQQMAPIVPQMAPQQVQPQQVQPQQVQPQQFQQVAPQQVLVQEVPAMTPQQYAPVEFSSGQQQILQQQSQPALTEPQWESIMNQLDE